jgi:hypothetical protein
MSTRRILIVEDEMMVEMFLKDMLVDLGHEIVASKRSFNEGMEVAQSAQFDFGDFGCKFTRRRLISYRRRAAGAEDTVRLCNGLRQDRHTRSLC